MESPTLIGIVLLFYFVPSIAASTRRHRNRGAICALNLLLGWTLLGWVVAFVWALTNNCEPAVPPVIVAEKNCPRCAERVKANAKVCRYCGHDFEPATVKVFQTNDSLRRRRHTA